MEPTIKIGDKVGFKDHASLPLGIVRGIWISEGGTQYQIEYVDGQGRIQTDWQYASALIVTV